MQTRVDNFWRVPLRQAYIRVKRGKYKIAIPHSKSAQYTLSISFLHHFAQSCCSVSNYFASKTNTSPKPNSEGAEELVATGGAKFAGDDLHHVDEIRVSAVYLIQGYSLG